MPAMVTYLHIDGAASVQARQLTEPTEVDGVQGEAGDYLVDAGVGLLIVERARFESAYARPHEFHQP